MAHRLRPHVVADARPADERPGGAEVDANADADADASGAAPTPPPSPMASVGSALRARRQRMGMTLAALAAQSGLSAPFISQVERGRAAPSIVSLMALAKALGVDIGYFVSVPKPRQIVRRAARPEVIETGLPARYVRLSGKHAERQLEALLIDVPAGLSAPTTSRDGEGFWYVLSGSIRMTVGDERFTLGTGDSAHFDQRHPYSMKNDGDTVTSMLWVGTPALF